MDLPTDEKIKSVVSTDLIGHTIVAVAHRIATIIDFDLILVLDEGRLAEFGPPSGLLKDPLSRFSRLAAAQGLRPETDEENGSKSPEASGLLHTFDVEVPTDRF